MRETFGYLIEIVSFDFFEVKDHIDLGFTKSEAWTERFYWLDYESFNFFENLGSISIFIAIYIVWVLFSVILNFARIHAIERSGWLKNRISSVYVTQSILRFMLETYFEILISSVLIIGMFRTREIWNEMDVISVII